MLGREENVINIYVMKAMDPPRSRFLKESEHLFLQHVGFQRTDDLTVTLSIRKKCGLEQ